MCCRHTTYIALIFLIFLSTDISLASDLKDKIGIGLRAGRSVHLEVDDFYSLEIFAEYSYPWESTCIPGFIIHTKSVLSAGVINQDGDGEPLSTLSQLIVLTNEGEDISFDLGGGIGLLGDDKIGDHDFGTVFQFNYNLGITLLDLYRNISAGYRWFHLSDGGIGDGQGLNRHVIELRYDY